MGPKRVRVLRPWIERLDDRCLLSTGPAGLSPSQILQAYGLNNLKSSTGVTLTGAGQTIALIEAYTNPNLAQELSVFDSQFKLTPLTTSSTIGGKSGPTMTQVNLATGRNASLNTNTGWAEEEALDVEWAHAIAPGANILVVEATSATTPALMAAVAYAESQKGVTVVSMSWGESEVRSDEVAYDSYFNKPGITFVASSGDSGPTTGAEWPAASPYVLSVGGTTLHTSTSGGTTTYVGETAWDNSSGGSSGGLSAFEKEPAFQTAVQSTGMLSTPDVSFDADPNTGVAVFFINPRGSASSGTFITVGGTSLGAPAFAAIVALADQDLALSKVASLDTTQTATDLFSLFAVAPGDFHSVVPATVTTGAGFGFLGRFAGAQSTTDDFTGLGSPVGGALIAGLVDEAEGVAAPRNTATTDPFNGLASPAARTTTGGGTTAGGQTTGQGGAKQGGSQTGGGGWWNWWPFAGLPRDFGPFLAIPPMTAPATGPSSNLPGAPTTTPDQTRPLTPPPVAPATNPFDASPNPGSGGLPEALGLLAPVALPGTISLIPIQNVPVLGPLFDEALATFEFRFHAAS